MKILVITAASLLPLAVIVVLVVAGVYVPVFRALGDLATQTMDEMIPLHELELALHRSTMAARNPVDTDAFNASVSSAAEHYGRLLEVIPSKDGKAVLQSSRRRWKTAEQAFRDAAPEAKELAAARYAAEIEHLSSELDGLHAGLHNEIIDQIKTASAAERRGILLITGAVALSLGIGVVGSILITRDRRRLVDSALTDGLTGTANRKAFEAKFRELVVQHAPFALILFDIDRFKTINDTHGHAAGDASLLAVVESARASLRQNDYLTRLGGDEFAVLAPGVCRGEAMAMAERIRRTVGARSVVAPDGGTFLVKLSMGVAEWPANGRTLSELSHAADLALYAAKRSGRDMVIDAPVLPG